MEKIAMSLLAILIVVIGFAQRIRATECDLDFFSQTGTVNPGTVTDGTACAIDCNDKEFTCTVRSSLTFTASCQDTDGDDTTGEWSATDPVEAERCRRTCVWSWTNPPSPATTITRSVGASTTFTVSVNDALADTNTVTSKLGDTELSIHTYGSDGTFAETSTTGGVTFTPVLGGGSNNNEYTLIHPGFAIGDNGKSISIESGGCDAGGSSSITLEVKYCEQTFASTNNPGTTDNALCGNGCEATFTCTDKTDLTFKATCGENAEWGATTPVESQRCLRTCVWTWTNPSSGTTLTRSVGASASFSVTVDDTLTSSTTVTWKSGNSDLTVRTYDGTKFGETSNDGNVMFSHTPGTPNTYSIDWPAGGVVEGDNGRLIHVISGGCEAGGTSPTITLEVKYCDQNAFGSEVNPGTTDNAQCGNGCEATFTCTNRPGLTFKATCGETAAWGATTPAEAERCLQTCTWEWTNPSSGSTLTRSVGAPAATFGVSVNDALGNDNTVTWKLGEMVLTVQTYKSSGTNFQETSNAGNVNFNFVPGDASTNNAYTIIHPSFVIGDNGKAITIVSTGCDSGGTSSGITIEVKYCDLTVYGNTATATTNADCAYNCERTFTCTDSSKTFQATCQEDATWSVADAPCAGTKAGVLIGLVILCSILSATHLI